MVLVRPCVGFGAYAVGFETVDEVCVQVVLNLSGEYGACADGVETWGWLGSLCRWR